MENGKLDQADETKGPSAEAPCEGSRKATLDCTDRIQVVGSRLSMRE